ncbi:hypothetical protein BE17_35625 [Sorangium cellulosum]|uniref:Peptidase M41 domain-containing protein n=1 Tax=Sorangium cellulosum TaxID=56 RepID=A0A150S7L9_SORCE|nr:hypothetical protein BE17_35625 [Sorangium cellulosum]
MWSSPETFITAPWHEAGHAVVAQAVGWRVDRIQWPPGGPPSAFVMSPIGPIVPADDFDQIGRAIAQLFGGYLAELLFTQTSEQTARVGAAQDFAKIEEFNPFRPENGDDWAPFRAMVGDVEGWRSFVNESYRVAHDILRTNDAALAALAAQLLPVFGRRGHLDGEPLRALLAPVKPCPLMRRPDRG